MSSYNRALEITRCESIETKLRTRRLLWAGTLIRMSGGRLPKRTGFGNLEGAVQCGEDGVGRRKGGRTERHPGVWQNGELESDGAKG